MKKIRRILATAMSFMMCLTLLSNTAFAQGVTPLIDSSDDIVYVNDIEDEDAVEETDVDEASDDFDVEEYDVVDDSETDNMVAIDSSDVTEELIESDDSFEEKIASDDEEESIPEDTSIVSDENEEPFVLSGDEGLYEENKSVLLDDDIEIVEETEEVDSIEITETIVSSPEETSYTLENDSLDSDFLLEEYIDREIDSKQTPMFNSSSFNGNKLTGVNKKIYDKAKIVIAEIANGEKESAVVSFTPEELGCAGEFSAADLGVSEIVDSSNHITTEAQNALKNKTGLNEFDFGLLGETLRADCPYERYWMGLKASMTWFEVGASNEGGIWKLYYGSELEYKIQVSVDYQGADEFSVDTTKTGAVKSAINSINGILQTAESKGDLEKIEYFRDQICSLVSYNDEAATLPSNRYGDPWQLIYVFDGDSSTNVVCEGYSKAFMYLCNKTFFSSSSINCYVVTGEMDGEPHMWNIIHWSDNTNYLVDVTNCDSLGRNNLFKALPPSGNVSDGYYFYSGIDNILYTYDPDTFALYSENELTIGSGIYGTLTKIFVNYDAYITGNKSVPFTVIKEGGSEDCQFRLDSAVNGSGDSILGASYNPTYGDENVFYITFPSQGKYTVTFSAKDTDNTVKTHTITVDVKKSLGITTYSDMVTELNNASTDENNPSVIQLSDDINTTAELQVKSGTYVILDLNGHIINRGGVDTSRVFKVDGNLTIVDSRADAIHNTENSDINNIPGGIITGGLGTDGGAINVSSTGSLVINGGTIAYNYGENGGAVYVKSGSFVMNGGSIYSNVANKSGGGVYLIYGKITISGGKISKNQAIASNGYGGGVCVTRGIFFNMNGGEISENTAQARGGGIEVGETDFNLNGDSVIKNNYAGGGAGIDYSSFDYSNTFTISGDALIEENHSTKDTSYGGGIYIDKGDLTLSGNALIKNNKALNTGGVYVYDGDLTMTDNASVDGNEADKSAGGIYCRKSVEMSGNASVKNNVNNGTQGAGGIWCTGFNISENATIYNNTFKTSDETSYGAGGIYLPSGTMIMTGGIISNNYSYGRGGGVYVGTGTLEISGGSIINNDAQYLGGGGVYNNKGKIKLSGNPVISDNNLITDDIYDSNLFIGYREYGCCLYITGILREDARIGVSLPGGPSLNSPLTITTGDTDNNYGYSLYNSEDPNNYLISDAGYLFYVDTDGEVKALTPLMLVTKRLNNGETVVLDRDIKRMRGDRWIDINDNVTATLDLNGHIIDAVSDSNTISLTAGVGKNLTIIDSNPNTTHFPAIKYTDPVTNEIVTVNGGIITGPYVGVAVDEGSTVTMKGGTIVNNNTGVRIYSSGTFNLEGGAVSGNKQEGIYIHNGAAMNMSGGIIRGNTNEGTGQGGGIYIADTGSLHLSGGQIKNNISKNGGAGIMTSSNSSLFLSGNPVVLNNKKIVSQDGENKQVEGNVNLYDNPNVYVTDTFLEGTQIGFSFSRNPSLASPLIITKSDNENNYGYSLYNSEDPNNYFISDKGYSFYVDTDGEVIALTPWMILNKRLNNGETVVLQEDVIRTNLDYYSISIDDNVTATLDLNGHIIDNNNDSTHVFSLNTGVAKNITIIDSNPNATHYPEIKFTDPVTNEEITVNGGIITGANTAISISEGSTVIMKGGSLVGNKKGVRINQYGIFYFEGGSVSGNTDSGIFIDNEAVLNMSGGTIRGNTKNNNDGFGAAVFVNTAGSFHLSGGQIINNTSKFGDAGIMMYNSGALYVSCNPIVSNNKKIVSEDGVERLVECNINRLFTVEGELTEGANLAVGLYKPISGTPTKFAKGFNTYNSGKKVSDYFTPIYEGCFVSLDESGDPTLYINNTITFAPGDYGTGSMESLSNIGGNFELPECGFTATLGKRFQVWKDSNADAPHYAGDTYNVKGDVTFTAIWEDIPLHTIIYVENGGDPLDQSIYRQYEGAEYGEMPVPAYTGYVFDGWYTRVNGGDKVKPTDIVQGAIHLYAHWRPANDTKYTVKHYLQDIDGNYKNAYKTENLTGVTLSSVTPDVIDYVGFTAPSKQTVEIKADGSTVVQYKYKRNSYAITWNLNGGKASGNYSKGNVLYGSTITAPKPTKQGYTFNGWNVSVPSKMPAKELTFTAKWIARTDTVYKVEHYKQGLDGKYTASPVVEKFKGTTGASVKPAVKKYDGFKSPSVQTVKIKADGSLVVKYYYTRNTYLLKWNYDGGSASGSYTSGKVKYGTKITAPKPTKKGYTFNGWDATVSKTMPAKNVTYKAKWKINSYSLTWDLAGGTASNKYTSGNVKYNAKITAPIPEKEGYVFVGWSVSVPSNMPAKNLKITAKWREKTQEENVTDFVKRFYSVVLERPQEEIDADVEGIGYWVDRLISGVDDGANVAYGFVYSQEFQKKKVSDEEYVLILYHSFFGRDPFDPNNYDEDGYNYWLNKLKSGTDRMDVLAGFTNSVEFQNLCDKYNINRGKLVPSEKPSYRKAHNLP